MRNMQASKLHMRLLQIAKQMEELHEEKEALLNSCPHTTAHRYLDTSKLAICDECDRYIGMYCEKSSRGVCISDEDTTNPKCIHCGRALTTDYVVGYN